MILDNNGTTELMSVLNTTVIAGGNVNTLSLGFSENYVNYSRIQWLGYADQYSVSLFAYQKDFVNDSINYCFWHGGIMYESNTNFNYYDANNLTKSIGIVKGNISTGAQQITLKERHLMSTESIRSSVRFHLSLQVTGWLLFHLWIMMQV